MKYKKAVIFMVLLLFISISIFMWKNKGLDISTKSNIKKDKCIATIRNKEEHSFKNKQLGEAEVEHEITICREPVDNQYTYKVTLNIKVIHIPYNDNVFGEVEKIELTHSALELGSLRESGFTSLIYKDTNDAELRGKEYILNVEGNNLKEVIFYTRAIFDFGTSASYDVLVKSVVDLESIFKETEINEEKREAIAEKYGLDTPPKNEGNISVDLGISGELKEICLFKEGEKEITISSEKAVDEFIQALNMEEWKAVVNWNLKIQPLKYITLGDDIILGIIEDEDKCYIKLDGEIMDRESIPYRYYEVNGSVVQYFEKYIN